MRRDVQEIFRMTPHEKQVMMFSATLNKEMRVVCKKFMQDVNILYFILILFDIISLQNLACYLKVSYFIGNCSKYLVEFQVHCCHIQLDIS